MAFDDDFATRKYINRLLDLCEQVKAVLAKVGLAAVERKSNQSQDHVIALTEYARIAAAEHFFNLLKLFFDPGLRLEALHECRTLRGSTTQSLVKGANLFFHIGHAQIAVLKFLLQALDFVALIFDVRNKLCCQFRVAL